MSIDGAERRTKASSAGINVAAVASGMPSVKRRVDVAAENGVPIATGTNSANISNATTQQLADFYLPTPAYLLEFFIIPGNSSTNYTNAETYLAAKWAI